MAMAAAFGPGIRLAGAHPHLPVRAGLPGDLHHRRHTLVAEATGESEKSPAPSPVSSG